MTKRYRRSKLPPTGLDIKWDYYIQGDRFTRNLLVTGFPREYGVGMLSYYSSNQNVKLFMTTERSTMDVHRFLNKEFKAKRRELKETKDEIVAQRLHAELDSLEDYITSIIHSRDQAHNVVMVYSITANSLKELDAETENFKNQLRTEGFKTETIRFMQTELMKLTTPVFTDNELPSVLKENYGLVTPSTSVAGFFPYTFQSLKDPGGFLYARERNQAGIVMWNPMLYDTHRELAVHDKRNNHNIIILGQSGSGKTTDMSLILRHGVREKYTIVWIDPENKNIHLTKRYGGEFVHWGTRDSRINIFDLKPISVEDGETDVDPYDTEIAIYNVIDELKNVLQLYDTQIKRDALDVLAPLVLDTYKKKNIVFTTKFKNLKNQDYPIMSDLLKTIQGNIEDFKDDRTQQSYIDDLRYLERKITPMTQEHRFYFDGHTTIDRLNIQGKMISFGSKVLQSASSELKNAMTYIMFRYAWSLCLDDDHYSILAIDEGHEFILEGMGASEIATFARRSRKYKNSLIFSSQEPTELNSADLVNGQQVKVHGKAILNNSAYKIIKRLDKDAVESLGELMSINETERDTIMGFKQGDSLFSYGDTRMFTYTLATTAELKEIETTE